MKIIIKKNYKDQRTTKPYSIYVLWHLEHGKRIPKTQITTTYYKKKNLLMLENENRDKECAKENEIIMMFYIDSYLVFGWSISTMLRN